MNIMIKNFSKIKARFYFELTCMITIFLFALLVIKIPFHRNGTLYYDDKKMMYHGQMKNNRMDGLGKFKYENGDIYEGYFHNGSFEGEGKFTSSQGWTFSGTFLKGQPNGKGVLISKDGKKIEGIFQNGVLKHEN